MENAVYTPQQKSALQEELLGGEFFYKKGQRFRTVGLEEQRRQHETKCKQCFNVILHSSVENPGKSCGTWEMFTYQIESIREALGWEQRDTIVNGHGVSSVGPEHLGDALSDITESGLRSLSKALSVSPKPGDNDFWDSFYEWDDENLTAPVELDWWAEVTVNPWERDEQSIEVQFKEAAWESASGPRNPRKRTVSAPESVWIATLSALGNLEVTGKQVRKPLNLWFPQESPKPDGTTGDADLAFYRTFLYFFNSLEGDNKIRAYCTVCPREHKERFFDYSMENILFIARHALTHYPDNQVEWYIDKLGYTRFRIPGWAEESSVNDTNSMLTQSLLEDAQKCELGAKQAHAQNKHHKAHLLSEWAKWYRKAAQA